MQGHKLIQDCMQIRAAALTATQCASYDQAKQWWMRTTGMGDSFATHFGASMLTGLATTTVTAPVDLIKTRMFMSGRHHGTVPRRRLSQSKQHANNVMGPGCCCFCQVHAVLLSVKKVGVCLSLHMPYIHKIAEQRTCRCR